MYPALESAASLLTTRAIETLQQLPDGCGNCAKAGCSYANKSSTSYYVGDVEFFTVRVSRGYNSASRYVTRCVYCSSAAGGPHDDGAGDRYFARSHRHGRRDFGPGWEHHGPV